MRTRIQAIPQEGSNEDREDTCPEYLKVDRPIPQRSGTQGQEEEAEEFSEAMMSLWRTDIAISLDFNINETHNLQPAKYCKLN